MFKQNAVGMSECSDNRKAAKGKGVGSAAPFGTVSANAVRHYAEFVLKRAARALGVITRHFAP